MKAFREWEEVQSRTILQLQLCINVPLLSHITVVTELSLTDRQHFSEYSEKNGQTIRPSRWWVVGGLICPSNAADSVWT